MGMYSKVVGTTFVEGGQEALNTLKSGDTLVLQKDPTNRFDPNAIAVRLVSGKRIGYLPAKTASSVYGNIGENTKCVVAEITGGGQLNRGCNVFIDGFVDTSKDAPIAMQNVLL